MMFQSYFVIPREALFSEKLSRTKFPIQIDSTATALRFICRRDRGARIKKYPGDRTIELCTIKYIAHTEKHKLSETASTQYN